VNGWVFDASPLILLGKMECLYLVPALSPEFRIPKAVVAEIRVGSSSDPAARWLGGAVIVLDDLAARKFAISFGIPVIGTVGLLLKAKAAGWIESVAPHLDALCDQGANLSSELIESALGAC